MKRNGSHHKYTVLKAVLCVFFVLVLICAGVVVWQYDNITAVMDAAKYSKEDIQQQMADNRAEIANSLAEYQAPQIRDFTTEEEEMIRKGELTVDDAVARILEESGVAADGSVASGVNSTNSDVSSVTNSNGSDSSALSGEAGTNEVADIVSEYTVKMYKLKAIYLGQIGHLVYEAKQDKKNGASLSDLASKYLSRVATLESTADAEVDSVLDELSAKLKSLDASTRIVDTMRTSYQKEKSLKKSYYLSLYESKK
jgi:hypothetical protein